MIPLQGPDQGRMFPAKRYCRRIYVYLHVRIAFVCMYVYIHMYITQMIMGVTIYVCIYVCRFSRFSRALADAAW